ncbi:serine hydrolase [Micromonospora lupini]|uniref:serine hydrolase n=1 Tax=Micromonospora lupini TaxID=285679 RepID=UPI00340768DC
MISSAFMVVAGISTAGVGVARLGSEAEDHSSAASPTPAVRVSPTPDPLVVARAHINAYVARLGGHLTLAVVDRQGGAGATAGARPFETASIVKVDILAALLLRQQTRGRTLSRDARRLATNMIVTSDNGAASTLWQEIGKSQGLAAANRTFGLQETTPSLHWGLTRTTAADQVRLLDALVNPDGPLNPESRRFLLDLMSRVDSSQRWGVAAAAGPDSVQSYVKNGWDTASDDNGRWLINSIGRIVEPDHDWLIAVLSDHHRSQREGIRIVEEAIKYALRELRAASSAS